MGGHENPKPFTCVFEVRAVFVPAMGAALVVLVRTARRTS